MGYSENALKIVTFSLNKIPGVKVNRASFLTETLKVHKDDLAILLEKGPIDSGLFTQKEIKKYAQDLASKRKWQTTAASFASGIPGGLAMAATIPADTIQYFSFSLKLAQEIAYLYGAKDFWDDGQVNEERVKTELMLYLATMFGVSGAASALRIVTKEYGKVAIKKLGQTAVTKTTWYPLLKIVASYIGVNMTKKTLAQAITKVVPIISGVISGGVTYYAMDKMTTRLINGLDKGVIYTDEEQAEDLKDIQENLPEIYDTIFQNDDNSNK